MDRKSNNMDRKSNITSFLFCLAIFLAVLFSPLYPSLCLAKKVTLGWDPNEEPDLGGYIVYRNIGSPGPPYKYSNDLPEKDLANPLYPMVTITGLQEEIKYYIAVTAYDTDGNESRYSDDVCVQIIDSAISVCSSSASSSGSSSSSSGGGGSGGACFISTSDLKISNPIFGPFFMFQPVETFFAILFLLLVGAARSILLRINSYISRKIEV